MSDKDFKVKNKLVVNGLTGGAGPLVANSNKEIDSVAYLSTLQGGTGTTTSPSAGQVLYSAGGTTYNPTTLNTLDVKGATYSADAPSSPVIGQIWVESDTSSDSFDPNIIRRKTFTATANQTVFTTDLEFIQGYEQVFFNGMLLIRNSDYTTASNTNVTLAAGAAAGDIIEVVSITNLNSINTATTTTNTFTGAQTITSSTNGNNFVINAPGGETPNFIIQGNGEQTFRFHNTNLTGTTRSSWKIANRLNSDWSWIWYTDSLGNGTDDLTLANRALNPAIRIDTNGNFGIGTGSPSAKLSVIGNALIAPTTTSSATTTYLDIRMTGTADGSPNSIRIGADASGGSFYGVGFIDTWRAGVAAATPLSLRTEGTERVKVGTGVDHLNMGSIRMWDIGQPTNMIVSGGTNCIKLWVNKGLGQNYYRGFVFDVYGGGGFDWGGNGMATYFGKFMVTFTGTDTARVHLIQEFGRSYLNNSGTEITYNTFSTTSDGSYLYLNINFKGINPSAGYKPLFNVITYDAGNGGSTSGTGSNNQVGWVSAI